jgi:Fe-S-cluster containining protein
MSRSRTQTEAAPTKLPKNAGSKAPRPQYDCAQCPAFCCSVYERVTVTPRDLRRLAKHFNLSLEETKKRFTKTWGDENILRRKCDHLLGETCQFLDPQTRGCTVYAGRPDACREYPTRAKCAYYDLYKFEMKHQDDATVIPLIRIEFKEWDKSKKEEEIES